MGESKNLRIGALSALVAVLIPVAGLVAWVHSTAWDGGPTASVQGTHADTAEWPGAVANWRPIALPNRLCEVGPVPCSDHYRSMFTFVGEPLGLFIPEFRGSVRVSVNEVHLRTYGSVEPPVQDLYFQPSYLQLPPHVLRQGANELQITVTNAAGRYHRLKPFYVGPHESLYAYARPLIWLVQDAGVLSIGVCVVAGLFAALLFLLAERSGLYIWFASFCFFTAMRETFFLLPDPQLEPLRLVFYFFGSHGQMACAVGLLAFLLSGVRRSWHAALLPGAALSATLALAAVVLWPYSGGQFANYATAGLSLAVSIGLVAGLSMHVRQRRTPVSAWVFALFLGSLLMTLSDSVPIVLAGRSTLYPLAHLAPVPLVLAFWLLTIGEYQRNLEALAVADAHQRSALAAQRRSIRQELHDGVGGQIASLLLLARRRSPELAAYLQESLDELRRTMDQLDDDREFSSLLDQLRARLDGLLASHGLASRWDVHLTSLQSPAPETIRVFYYALQELIHNAIRHSGAQTVEFAITHRDGSLLVQVRDDGRGIDSTALGVAAGRGLRGLRDRVEALGGWLDVRAVPGAQVSFALPLGAGGGAR